MSLSSCSWGQGRWIFQIPELVHNAIAVYENFNSMSSRYIIEVWCMLGLSCKYRLRPTTV